MKLYTLKSTMVPTILILLLFSYSLANTKCMVDMCKDCDFTNVYTCNSCEPGYYLVSFDGTEKGKSYQNCWNRSWLYLALASLLYCPCLYCLCCYLLYRRANKIIRGPDVDGGTEFRGKAHSSGGNNAPNVNYNGVPNNASPQNINIGNQGPGGAPNVNMNSGYPNSPNVNVQPQGYNASPGQNIPLSSPNYTQNTPVVTNNGGYPGRVLSRRVISTTRRDPPIQPSSPLNSPQRNGPIRIIERDPTLIIERSPSMSRIN